jgi:hypothetical protein
LPSIVVSAHGAAFPEPVETLRELGDRTRERGWVRVERCDDGLLWVVGGLGRFWITASGREVRYELVDGHDPSDAEQAIVGPVLGTALQLQGVLTLHASALVAEGVAFAISAPSGFGKSTLATALTRGGALLLGDDVLPLEATPEGYLALPYLPRLKLWGDSLDAFGLDDHRAERVASWADKRRVTLDAGSGLIASEPARLAVVYMLAPTVEQTAPAVAELEPVEAVLALQGAIYQSDLMTPDQAAAALHAATDLATRVRVRRLSYRRGYESLDEACATVLADVAALDECAP